MLSVPAYFFAVVCTFHLARTLGLVRLPRARSRVAGIRYAGVEIRLVVEVITSGGEIVPLGNTTGTIRVSGIWRGLLSCWDSGKRLSSICDSESVFRSWAHTILPLGCHNARVVITGVAIIVWVQIRPDRATEEHFVEEVERSN